MLPLTFYAVFNALEEVYLGEAADLSEAFDASASFKLHAIDDSVEIGTGLGTLHKQIPEETCTGSFGVFNCEIVLIVER